MLTVEQLSHSFDEGSLRRGVSYANSNKVVDAQITREAKGYLHIKGKVEGSQFQTYTTNIKIDQSDFEVDASCSCPVGYNCKHAVAIILSFKGHTNQSKPKLLSLEGDTDYHLDQWITRCRKSFESKATAQEKIYFILDVHQSYHGFYVTVLPQSAKYLKRGGLGKPKFFRPTEERHFKQLSKAEMEAFAILELYNERRGYMEAPFEISADDATELFKRLIATEECYWHNIESPALKMSEAINVDFKWELAKDGGQFIDVPDLPEGYLILPSSPLFYINQNEATIGVVKHNFPISLGKFLINSPVIPPTSVKAFTEKLAKETQGKVPLPKVFEAVKQIKSEPKPYLYVFEHPLEFFDFENWSHDNIETYPCIVAELSFDYDGTRFLSNTPEDSFTKVDGEMLVQIPRDFLVERNYINSFEENYEYERLTELDGITRHTMEEPRMLNSFFICHNDGIKELQHFKNKVVPELRKLNWTIEFEDLNLFQEVIEIDEWYTQLSEEEGSGIDWFNLELGIVINGKPFDLLPHLITAVKESRLIEESNSQVLLSVPNTGLIPIPKKRLDTIMNVITQIMVFDVKTKEYTVKLNRQKAALLAEMEKAFKASELRRLGDERLFELGKQLTNFKKIKNVKVPKKFKAELRSYQQQGVNWLQFLREYQLAGILADDMGLGKTVQALAHLAIEQQKKRLTKPCLILAPTSVIYNWAREMDIFTPNLSYLLWHGDKRKENVEQLSEVQVILSTYPLLVRDKELLLEQEFYYIILDEAQTIKNAQAKMTQVVQQLKAEHRICLTGTPLENHLGELWSQFNFLMPGLLGSQKQFKTHYRTPIEKHGNAEIQQALSSLIRPFMLRRTKQEVVTELPDKTEIIQAIELSKEQRDLYETIRLSMNKKIQKAIDAKGLERSQIIILDALLKLRQVCCHPQLLSMEAAKKVKASAKLDTLMDLLTEMVEEGRKILLFSQFTSMLALIENELVDRNIVFTKLTGSTKNRAAPIKKFQEGDASVFLISLKAGGTGLNLTAADTVIHFDPWWNPAVESQATDRAHRIGQKQKVFVYKLVCNNTVEEKILEMQDKKRALMDAVFSGGSHKGAITKSDLDVLFGEV